MQPVGSAWHVVCTVLPVSVSVSPCQSRVRHPTLTTQRVRVRELELRYRTR